VAKSAHATGPHASWWEVLGAWLHVWTPPRDVEIPSPRRAVVVTVVLVAAAVVVALTLVAPAIDRTKERDAAQSAREREANRAAIRVRMVAEQRAKFARAPRVARLYAAGRREASLAALTVAARGSVDKDIRARVAAGVLSGPILRVQCSSRSSERGARVHLDCLAVTADRAHKIHELLLGHPFVVGASLRDGRYAWCKDNRKPGEGSFGRGVQVPLPAACGR